MQSFFCSSTLVFSLILAAFSSHLKGLFLMSERSLNKNVMKIIAHRGASHEAPENTLLAMREAFRQGADGVELDVQLSRDNKIMVIHDDNLLRTAGYPYKVHDLRASELKKFDVGTWKGPQFNSEKIPFLEEVVSILPEDKFIFIELKAKQDEIVASMSSFLSQIEDKIHQQIILISFQHEQLNRLKEKFPKVKSFYLTSFIGEEKSPHRVRSIKELEELVKKAKKHKIDGLDLEWSEFISPQMITYLKDLGFELAVWSYSNEDTMTTYLDCKRLKIDFFTTNFPKRAKSSS